MFYSNSCSLTPVSDAELLNPLGFLGDSNVLCYNEATLGGILDGVWSRERPNHEYKLGNFIFNPHPPRMRAWPEIKLLLYHACVRKLHKSSYTGVFNDF